MPETPDGLIAAARKLPCFTAITQADTLGGGKTNHNVLVEDRGQSFVVRFGQDIPEHGVMRWNELALTQAASRAGIGPAVHYAQPGVLVLDYVAARPLCAEDRDDAGMVAKLAELVRRVHRDVTQTVEGPVLCFSVPHILRDYTRQLTSRSSAYADELPKLLAKADILETAVGSGEMVVCHNDLLPGNILIGSSGFWLIDWEYAGFGNPLFDLGGLASNNAFSGQEERALLEAYYDRQLSDELWRRYAAMKCASLLRETLWSMVSEITSKIDFDYGAYTAENLAAFRAAYQDFQTL